MSDFGWSLRCQFHVLAYLGSLSGIEFLCSPTYISPPNSPSTVASSRRLVMSVWPPKEGLSTVNVPRKDTVFTTSASTRINAPASLVFSILLHVSEYKSWNSFCPQVTSKSENVEKDTSFTLHVVMDASKPASATPTQLRVSDVSTPEHPSKYIPQSTLDSDASYTSNLSKVYRIAWKTEGGFVARGLRSERFQEVTVLGEEECEYRTWENMGGMLAHTVKWLYKQTLKDKFALWAADLKREAERVRAEQNKGGGGAVARDDTV